MTGTLVLMQPRTLLCPHHVVRFSTHDNLIEQVEAFGSDLCIQAYYQFFI